MFAQRQPVGALEERLPVRDRAHLDRGEHRLAEVAAVERGLERAHRLVVAHVLVDGENLAGVSTSLDGLLRLRVVGGDRLLGQDALDVGAAGTPPR